MMGKIAAAWGAAALLILAVPGDGGAFRCGAGLVLTGDKSGKVLIECGPPTSREVVGAKTKGKTTKTERAKQKHQPLEKATYKESSQKVERWYYNCGAHDFIYVLTFEGGVLTKEETEGYGRGKSDCLGKR
jgi:hypothetical protein